MNAAVQTRALCSACFDAVREPDGEYCAECDAVIAKHPEAIEKRTLPFWRQQERHNAEHAAARERMTPAQRDAQDREFAARQLLLERGMEP